MIYKPSKGEKVMLVSYRRRWTSWMSCVRDRRKRSWSWRKLHKNLFLMKHTHHHWDRIFHLKIQTDYRAVRPQTWSMNFKPTITPLKKVIWKITGPWKTSLSSLFKTTTYSKCSMIQTLRKYYSYVLKSIISSSLWSCNSNKTTSGMPSVERMRPSLSVSISWSNKDWALMTSLTVSMRMILSIASWIGSCLNLSLWMAVSLPDFWIGKSHTFKLSRTLLLSWRDSSLFKNSSLQLKYVDSLSRCWLHSRSCRLRTYSHLTNLLTLPGSTMLSCRIKFRILKYRTTLQSGTMNKE